MNFFPPLIYLLLCDCSIVDILGIREAVSGAPFTRTDRKMLMGESRKMIQKEHSDFIAFVEDNTWMSSLKCRGDLEDLNNFNDVGFHITSFIKSHSK